MIAENVSVRLVFALREATKAAARMRHAPQYFQLRRFILKSETVLVRLFSSSAKRASAPQGFVWREARKRAARCQERATASGGLTLSLRSAANRPGQADARGKAA